MTQPLLSILIPTVVGREEMYDRLFALICKQYNGFEVEMAVLKDNKEITIGEKREKLYQMANGVYSWQIDDDDLISDDAIRKIINQIRWNSDVDCITFQELVNIDGKYQTSNHSIIYDKWQDNFDGFDYVRTPFFKDVIKTEICKSVPIPHIRWNEDEQWSYAIKPFLKTETHLDEELYLYIHNSSDPTERYGLDKT